MLFHPRIDELGDEAVRRGADSGEVNEPISESELRRLENATPAQARALLATEGYMAAQVRTEREAVEGGDATLRSATCQSPTGSMRSSAWRQRWGWT